MPTVVGVKLRNAAKPLYFDPSDIEMREGDPVLVQTERGTEFGEVVQAAHEVADAEIPAPLKPVERVATDDDIRRAEELRDKEHEALTVYRRLVSKHKLDMKPIDVEYLFDGDKAVFYFVAEERVDFRDLVRDLAAEFKVRVDMRQVGVRDEARIIGGLGHCGETLCCVRFGGEFQPVSIRMAKEQDLPLNPQKISGLCGRLMCCLRYEFEAYKDFKGRAPKRNAIIETPKGLAKVVDLNTPRELVTMRLEDGERLTVPLSGMECGKGEGCSCPCKVRPDALPAEPDPLAGYEPIAVPAAEKAPSAKTSTAEAGGQTASKPRKRRRGGGGGSQSGDSGAQSGGQAKGEKQPGRQAQKQPAKPQQAKSQEAKAPEAPAKGAEAGAKPAGRRRRRRRGPGKGGAEPAA